MGEQGVRRREEEEEELGACVMRNWYKGHGVGTNANIRERDTCTTRMCYRYFVRGPEYKLI